MPTGDLPCDVAHWSAPAGNSGLTTFRTAHLLMNKAEAAMDADREAWRQFTAIEAKRIMERLGMKPGGGDSGLGGVPEAPPLCQLALILIEFAIPLAFRPR